MYTNVFLPTNSELLVVRVNTLNNGNSVCFVLLISCVSEYTTVRYRHPETTLFGLIIPLELKQNTKTRLMNGSAARSPLGCCCLIRGAMSKEMHTLHGDNCQLQGSSFILVLLYHAVWPYCLDIS